MLERMHRLKYNRRQHRHKQGIIEKEKPFFHRFKGNVQNVKISLTLCETELKPSFAALLNKTDKLNEKITATGFADFDVLL
jgi:hypothetical protein